MLVQSQTQYWSNFIQVVCTDTGQDQLSKNLTFIPLRGVKITQMNQFRYETKGMHRTSYRMAQSCGTSSAFSSLANFCAICAKTTDISTIAKFWPTHILGPALLDSSQRFQKLGEVPGRIQGFLVSFLMMRIQLGLTYEYRSRVWASRYSIALESTPTRLECLVFAASRVECRILVCPS